ncbi:hypothetical protein JTB14_026260 [Gonioctena quinquepunctata]|nr:hypothetical protein JTB14_026260 [Gonioctena quinquepunctata]
METSSFNTPRMTLSDKYYGRKKIECKTVVSTISFPEEEKILVNWILNIAKQGFPITKTQLYDSVRILMIELKRPSPFPDNGLQRHWYEGFLSRHKQISKRVTQNLSNPKTRIGRLTNEERKTKNKELREKEERKQKGLEKNTKQTEMNQEKRKND